MSSKAYWKYDSSLDATDILVAAGPCSLKGYHFLNTTAAVAYVQIFDAAAASDVTIGTTTPDFVLGIPASAGALMALGDGIKFTKGIVAASCTAVGGSTGAIIVATFFIGS